jgi:hypothetical protein
MPNNILLGLLELSAITSCFWGLFHVYYDSASIITMIYNGLWFFLGIASNIMGLFYIRNLNQSQTFRLDLQ